ncbi:acidic mammalian chitinase-like isoform X1, partial [Argonauta hians]
GPDVFRRVCYFTNWAQYRPGIGRFTISNIESRLCSHIHYAFAKINDDELVHFEANDIPTHNSIGMYKQIVNLKNINPALKVVLSVGGYSAGNRPFSQLAESPTKRRHFIRQSITFLRRYSFDGLEINWEYPLAKDERNFASLVKEFREEFNQRVNWKDSFGPFLLVCAVPAGKNNIDVGHNFKSLADNMDYITVMSYDLHGIWNRKTGQNAPLHAADYEIGAERQLNVEWAMNYWLSKGIPNWKLNMGIATYGRGFTLASPTNTNPGSPILGPSPAGTYTRQAGILAYYEICPMKTSSRLHWMSDSKVPYLVKGSTWVGFDNIKSIKDKVKWLKTKAFGGYSVWALDMDDFSNVCQQGRYPILRALVDALGYQQISHLKTQTRPIKFILTIGGFNAGNSPFRRIVSSQRSRKVFVSHVVSYLRRYHFDGLDIDWEYPTAVDKRKFVKLAWELRKAFDKEGKGNRNQSPLLLSCAVPAGKTKIDAGFDVTNLAQ